MSPARFRWGILFILVGVILLLNNIGELDWWVWTDIVSLWPLILIAIGLEKIFTRSKIEFVAYLPILGLAAAVLYVAFAGLDSGDSDFSRRGSTYRYTVDMDDAVQRIEARFEFGDVDVSLNNTGSKMFRVRANSWRQVPDVEYEELGEVAHLEMSPKRRLPNWIRIDRWGRSGDWDMFLSDQMPITMDCFGDESDMNLDCRDLYLESLRINSEKGDIRLKLGSLADSIKVKLEGWRADFRLSVPEGCGIRVSDADQELIPYLEGKGLIELGGYYVSDGYDTLTPRIDINLAPSLTRFSIDFQ